MRPWLASALAISLSLVSCGAKSAPTRITVNVTDAYAGSLRLDPCVKDANDPVLVDEKGVGKTAACPLGGDVEIVVIKSNGTIFIPREQISISRAGDGFPVSITAVIP